MEENKWNKFEEQNKNNLLILNLFIIFLDFFFLSTFPFYFLFLTFSLNFYGTKHNLSRNSILTYAKKKLL